MLAAKKNHSRVTALEWLNGRRYPQATDLVRGALLGLDLSTDATSIYGGLVDCILFGIRKILSGMKSEGLPFEVMIATGGIARKSPVLLQRLSSILDLPVLALSEQETCSLGAAMYGSVASGQFAALEDAQRFMAAKQGVSYTPDRADREYFATMFERYCAFGDALEPIW